VAFPDTYNKMTVAGALQKINLTIGAIAKIAYFFDYFNWNYQ
jgi:hypothetical protein